MRARLRGRPGRTLAVACGTRTSVRTTAGKRPSKGPLIRLSGRVRVSMG